MHQTLASTGHPAKMRPMGSPALAKLDSLETCVRTREMNAPLVHALEMQSVLIRQILFFSAD